MGYRLWCKHKRRMYRGDTFRNIKRPIKFYRRNTLKEEYISIRCSKPVKDYLTNKADQQDRSLSSQIMNMLKQTDSQLAELLKPVVVAKDQSKSVSSQDHA